VRALVVVSCLPLIAVPALAVAKPLPAGMTVKIADEHLVATRGGVTVTVDAGYFSELGKVDLADDGAAIVVHATRCWSDDADALAEERFPLAPIEAAFENRAGMKAHLAKKYAAAIAHFTIAAKDDPETPVYATNLLSAQSMAGKLDDADRTIATYARRNPAWFAWRFAVDRDLKALRGRPSTKLVATPGTAPDSLTDTIAYSPLGLVAHEVEVDIYDGIPDGSSSSVLSIVEVATGRELLTLPSFSTCSLAMNGDPEPLDKACAARVAKEAKANQKVIDAVLVSLGFVVANGFLDVWGSDKKQHELVAPDGRRLEVDDGTFTLDGKPIDLGERVYGVGFVPHAIVATTRGGKRVGCGADGPYRVELSITATR
jgi:hypothetical protein